MRTKKKVEQRELMGATEVARTVGIAPNNIDKLAGLPEPAYRLAAGRFWWADEIREYTANREARRAAEAEKAVAS